eukprot:c54294_g1_i1.p2 GENE.c54294_g1_i1~~c54294_g1_i1.p2  ORF type:complete len:338 (+),score=72.84 c54294_g1_i1:39-1052(+)
MASSSQPVVSSERNPGIPMDYGWIESVQVNRPAVELRCQTHLTRRSIKKKWQLGWLLRVVSLIDLTTLSGDDTWGNVSRLCFKANSPVEKGLVDRLNLGERALSCGAVCVYPNRVADAKKTLESIGATHIPIASVAAGFPAGATPDGPRVEEIRLAIEAGATEIDIVVSRDLIIDHKWDELYDQIRMFRDACGDKARLKSILAVGEIPTLRDVYKASLVAMFAGSDFIKTSTGKEALNATLPVGLVMIRAIRDYHDRTGFKVGFKPAGGLRSAKDAMMWLSLMYEELGAEWTYPNLFRIGASALLTDIERQIEHGTSGAYGAPHYFGVGSTAASEGY